MTTTQIRPTRLPAPADPVWLTEPETDWTDIVIFLHAPGENRTGNNYLFRELADACRSHGLAAVRFDLPGCGESLAAFGAAAWAARVAEVEEVVMRRRPQATVHHVARGVSCAFLPERAGAGLRIALSPPEASSLASLLPVDCVELAPELPLSEAEEALWSALGAEPNLVGGLRLPAEEVRSMIDGLSSSRYDLAVLGSTSDGSGPMIRMATTDPLFRHESDRVALCALIPRYLKGWQLWLPER
jgi:hypothetical protein